MTRRKRFNETCNDAFRSLDIVEDQIKEMEALAKDLLSQLVDAEKVLKAYEPDEWRCDCSSCQYHKKYLAKWYGREV